MSHLGGTLRRLRLESGLSLRDLARGLGVSSAYLSRVEHGLDASPTVQRLEDFALELGVPPEMLFEAGQKTSPLIERYIEQEPQAASLFLALAQLDLDPAELAETWQFIIRRFAHKITPAQEAQTDSLANLLHTDRIIVGLSSHDLTDAYELGCARLALQENMPDISTLLQMVEQRNLALDPYLSQGLALVTLLIPDQPPTAALVSLAKPFPITPRGELEVVILLTAPKPGRELLRHIAHISRLNTRGLTKSLHGILNPAEAMHRIQELEQIGM